VNSSCQPKLESLEIQIEMELQSIEALARTQDAREAIAVHG
jgi:hypothetical protein